MRRTKIYQASNKVRNGVIHRRSARAGLLLPLYLASFLTVALPSPRAWGVPIPMAPGSVGRQTWYQFGGNFGFGNTTTFFGDNVNETFVSSSNFTTLKPLTSFSLTIPSGCDVAAISTPVIMKNVNVSGALHDVGFVTTKPNGNPITNCIVAFDAYSGTVLWNVAISSGPLGTSMINSRPSPAIDPVGGYVYSAGVDGQIHQYQVGSGTEITTLGFPQYFTYKLALEWYVTSLQLAQASDWTGNQLGPTNFLYVAVGGCDTNGISDDCQGHTTIYYLSGSYTGSWNVFNAVCSEYNEWFEQGDPRCSDEGGGIWATAGVTFDPNTNALYLPTGNSLGSTVFSPTSNDWPVSVLKLNPDGSSPGGNWGVPLDSFTPNNDPNSTQTENGQDYDVSSVNTLILPTNNGSLFPNLAVQSGKDSVLHLINLNDMSSSAPPSPGNVGGDVNYVQMPVADAEGVTSAPALWTDSSGNIWIFIGTDAAMYGYEFSPTGGPGGTPTFTKQQTWTTGKHGGAFVAAGVLYYVSQSGTLYGAALPNGAAQVIASGIVGVKHDTTPLLLNGILYVPNGTGLSAFSLNGTQPNEPTN